MKQIKKISLIKLILIIILILTVNMIFLKLPKLKFFKTIQAKESTDRKIDKMIDQKDFDAETIVIKKKNKEYEKVQVLENIQVTDLDQKKSKNEIKKAETKEEINNVKLKIKDYLDKPDIEYAQPNYIYETLSWSSTSTQAKPSDYDDTKHWYYEKSKVPEMWKYQNCPTGDACGGVDNVLVAVIDTGLAFENYDDSSGLTGVVYPGSSEYSGIYLYTNSLETANDGLDNDCNGIVDDYHGADVYASYQVGTDTCTPGGSPRSLSDDYKKAGHPNDNYGHGSIVTGNIASVVDNGSSVSPSFNVKILPISANIHFTRSFSTILLIEAIDYAQNAGADVINMSLGGKAYDNALENKIDEAYSNNITLVAASGNYGTTEAVYPASYSNVISVGAINSNNSRSSYSSYGSTLDITAYVGYSLNYGSAVWQSSLICYSGCDQGNINSGIEEKLAIGTSFAAPQVSALAAVLKSINSSYSPYQIKNIILNGANDIGEKDWDNQTGWGALDFYKSVTERNTAVLYKSKQAVYRFWSPKNESHFYTASDAEKNYVINNYDDYTWTYEGIAYYAFINQQDNSYPVYRFWSAKNQTHFYTINNNEKNIVINNYDDYVWKYEGIAFYAYINKYNNNRPLYRFWSPRNESHFFTASYNEKMNVINNYDDYIWKYEGIGFYVL